MDKFRNLSRSTCCHDPHPLNITTRPAENGQKRNQLHLAPHVGRTLTTTTPSVDVSDQPRNEARHTVKVHPADVDESTRPTSTRPATSCDCGTTRFVTSASTRHPDTGGYTVADSPSVTDPALSTPLGPQLTVTGRGRPNDSSITELLGEWGFGHGYVLFLTPADKSDQMVTLSVQQTTSVERGKRHDT